MSLINEFTIVLLIVVLLFVVTMCDRRTTETYEITTLENK